MRLLLDTHACLWFTPEQLRNNRIELRPIELHHTFAVTHLPLHHRDPFDRLLTAQAHTDGIPIISADEAFRAYAVTQVW